MSQFFLGGLVISPGLGQQGFVFLQGLSDIARLLGQKAHQRLAPEFINDAGQDKEVDELPDRVPDLARLTRAGAFTFTLGRGGRGQGRRQYGQRNDDHQ